MNIVILGLVTTLMFGALSFFTLKGQDKLAKMSYLTSSAISLSVLVISSFISLFWALFVAALVICLALYFESYYTKTNGKYIKNGVFGGVWLVVPVYTHLALST
jgi:heme/copper-type cytochrome/quinol oxidase subunit 2